MSKKNRGSKRKVSSSIRKTESKNAGKKLLILEKRGLAWWQTEKR